MRKETEMIAELLEWGKKRETIRSMIQSGSLMNPKAPRDILSDYDIMLIVNDPEAFVEDGTWHLEFGKVLTSVNSEFTEIGIKARTRLVIYDDGMKIDFSVWPIEILRRVRETEKLPDFMNIGYRVLVDKDGLTEGLNPPLYSGYIPLKPTKTDYLKAVEEFWWDTTYYAKNLWRDELYFAKFMESELHFNHLQKMIEWRIECDRDWKVQTGKYGRHFKKYMAPDLWAELENTFTDGKIEENWENLFRMTDFFRKISLFVGGRLGYEYPSELDDRVTEYLKKIKDLPKDAKDL